MSKYLSLEVYWSSYVLVTGFRSAEFVSRQDIHDDGQYSDHSNSDRVDDNSLVHHPAVPLPSVDTYTYKQLTQATQDKYKCF